MPTPSKGPRLGGSPAHERLMLANLATPLFKHGRIQTTETKAKRLRPLAEQLITKAKRAARKAARADAVAALAGDDEDAEMTTIKPASTEPTASDEPVAESTEDTDENTDGDTDGDTAEDTDKS